MEIFLNKIIFLAVFCLLNIQKCEQTCTDALITSWVKSTGTATSGKASGIAANVQTIAYDTNYVYILASGIPSYRYPKF